MDLTFFGLTLQTVSEYRVRLFTQIHDIVFHGKGGYDWSTVYSMPIWLRNFTFNQINDYYKKENEAQINASKPQNNLVNADGTINKSAFAEVSKQYKDPSTSKPQFKVPKFK